MKDTRKAFAAISEEFVEVFMRHHPVTATRVGLHDYDDRMPDDSPDGVSERAAWFRDIEQRLVASVPWEDLAVEQRVDYAIFRSKLAMKRAELEEMQLHRHNPVMYAETALNGMYLLMARQFAPLEERKEPLLARMMNIPEYLENACANLDEVPDTFMRVASEINSFGPAYVEDIVRTLVKEFPGEEERIEHAASRARVGFLQFQEYLETEVKASKDVPFAIGERWMNFRLEREHMLSMDCEALEALGREQVVNARAMLESEAKELDAARTWQEQIEDARGTHPEPLRLREAYEAEVERARRFVEERGLVPLPDAPVEVIDTPVFERAIVPYASYLPPAPFDAEQTGYLYVTPIELGRSREDQEERLRGHNYGGMPLIVAHESFPGHHLQTCIANNRGSRLRRLAESDLFSEGWAMYCEELMYTQGFFLDPVSRLFQLQDLLWRACRVVLDIALHCGKMTLAQAQDYLVREAALDEATAEAEVKRYLLTPTQPMSYLVGATLLVEIREEARRKLGDRFDLSEFHAALLEGGTLPPALVREELWGRLGVKEPA